MCGFLAYFGESLDIETLEAESQKIQYRGPDNTKSIKINEKMFMSFHRLSIIDVTENANQPLFHPDDPGISLVCNGEIYNYKELIKKFDLKVSSGSDCEVIVHLYKKLGLKKMLSLLDGVFSFCLYDSHKDVLFVARDPYGVRPCFISISESFTAIASELKALSNIATNIIPFQPGCWWSSDYPTVITSYCSLPLVYASDSNEKNICEKIRDLLSAAVNKRLMSDREVGCLLSGGLDSSLVASLVAQSFDNPKNLKTFSIGMKGSPDLKYARLVADHIKSDHHEVMVSEKEFLDSIEKVIYNIESYDTTTVRASVGNYLVSKYISENTDVKVVFNGDGADEVCMGYVYNINAPTEYEFYEENKRLLSEIYLFDVLRSDRSISSNGLEPRTPFLDREFVRYYMSLKPSLKMFGNGKPEKYLLRKSFSDENILPDDVLWRNKCAFSDGVSDINNSWHEIIKELVDKKITDEEFERERSRFSICKPALKESYYYRKIYESHFGRNLNLIPHFWMPRWVNTLDPSARELDGYRE
tara:strand:- start:910 stop:2499 length:1590 start_codon:yes stop_codon:yes gene_type:complete